jgi:hypothetical protein
MIDREDRAVAFALLCPNNIQPLKPQANRMGLICVQGSALAWPVCVPLI